MLANVLLVLVMFYCKAKAGDDEEKNKKIEALEKQKSELLVQINSAIDESVKSLLKANDTEAAMGLEYMRDLKEHIQELNKSNININDEKEKDFDSKSDLENRRSFKGLEFFKKIKPPKDDPFDFDTVLKPKKISAKEWKEMVANRIKMQKKLDEWLLERQKVKERLEKYKMQKKRLVMSGKYEKCPRFGYQGKKKRVKENGNEKLRRCKFTESMGEEFEKCSGATKNDANFNPNGNREKSKSKLSRKNKYPCCRKCCKKSYMGCL